MPLFEKHPALTRRDTGLVTVAVGSGEAPHAPATKHLALRAVARSKRGAGAGYGRVAMLSRGSIAPASGRPANCSDDASTHP
jgi:hypothetical protein